MAEMATRGACADEEDDDLAALEAALEAADRAQAMTVQQEVEAMAAVRQQAEEHGVNEKSHGVHGWAGSMMRKFERFLEKHGARLGYVAAAGPSIEIVKHFVDYCSSGAGRESFSCVGRPGMCDKYFELQLPYTLAQRVFGMMGVPSWVGLSRGDARRKAEPYKEAIQERK